MYITLLAGVRSIKEENPMYPAIGENLAFPGCEI